MSNHWDLYCVTCHKGCGFHWNHGNDRLQRLLNHRAEFLQLVEAMTPILQANLGWGFELQLQWETGEPPSTTTFCTWLLAHAAHDVRVRSEYGEYHDSCDTYVRCICGHELPCALLPGHDGPHIEERRIKGSELREVLERMIESLRQV